MFKMKPSLARRFVLLMVLGFASASVLLMQRTEAVLEEVLLDQTKQQAHILMLGIEDQIKNTPNPTTKETLQSVIDSAMARDFSSFGFVVHEMYFFNAKGETLAHSIPGDYPIKEITSEFATVFNQQQSSLGNEVEFVADAVSGEIIPTVCIIVPLRIDGKVVAALEVEINLEKTLTHIKAFDDVYEHEMLVMIIVFILVMLVFITWVNHRWVLSPIKLMVQTTEKIANGEFAARVGYTSRDELGRLAISVNKMATSVESLIKDQEEAHLQMLQSLAKALEAKDSYTAGHSGRVAKYSHSLGKRLGLDEEQLKLLKQGALIHDLGKIGIPDNILNKPSQLDADEMEIMRRHPVMTAKIVRPLKRFKEFAEIAAWHHERWDGKGYPDGLKGDEVPLLARIVGIADTWDAMTGDRVYRKAMPLEKAINILDAEKDSGQWDPQLIREFITMVREEVELKAKG